MQTDLFSTPHSNTGLKSQLSTNLTLDRTKTEPIPIPIIPSETPALSIDGFTLMWDEDENFAPLVIIKQMLLVEFDFTKSTGMTIGVKWDHVFRGSLGALYMYRITPNGIRYRLSIPGKVCSSVPLDMVLRFFEIIHQLNPNVVCSRVDICLDDFTKRLNFEQLSESLKSGDYSGFRTSHGIQNYDASNGWTVYLGSRQSEHMVRIYNKSAESRGRIDSVRWESEYKGEKANAIFKSLSIATTLQSSVKLLKGYVLGKIHFIDRTDKNLSRCEKLDWWSEFLDYLSFEPCQILLVKVVTSIESKICWIGKQVEKSLALISRAFGTDKFQNFIDASIESGTSRFKKFDDILLIEYLNARMSYSTVSDNDLLADSIAF